MDVKSTYTLGLALEDFVPVILFAIGLYLLYRMSQKMNVDSGPLGLIAVVLVTLGGLSKASWKLILVTTGNDLDWMNNALFVFLAPGFIFLTWAISVAQRKQAGKPIAKYFWAWPLGLSIITLAISYYIAVSMGGRSWVFMLLGMTTIFNVIVSTMVIQHAFKEKMVGMAALFLLNIILVFVLSGLARMPEQTVTLQWIEQLTNTVSTGAFAFAAWKLGQRVTENLAAGKPA